MDIFGEAGVLQQEVGIYKIIFVIEREVVPNDVFWITPPGSRDVLVVWEGIKTRRTRAVRQDVFPGLPESVTSEQAMTYPVV
jgi:hypothetical protein